MFDSGFRKTNLYFIIGLVVCWLASPRISAAEPEPDPQAPRVLVVVTDPLDAECVRRIGREWVQVESLFAFDSEGHRGNYRVCNKRALGLLSFRLFVLRGECSSAAFWCERLAQANPKGKVHRMSRPLCDDASECDGRRRQAADIHAALVLILPEHRERLNANLKAELQLLRLRQFGPRQIVIADRVKSRSMAMVE